MGEKLRILLADDHNMVRAGLKALIDSQDDMEVVGEAADGDSACRLAAELAPEVTVMDVSMPVLNGRPGHRTDLPGTARRPDPGPDGPRDRGYIHRFLRAPAPWATCRSGRPPTT
ncbi:MAG: response regulator transcription factor [Isosphaeraceae bacterium]